MASLYEYIASAVVDGGLPRDFSLPSLTENENELKWADGALDGVTVYHMGIPELSEDDHTLISDAVRAANNKDHDLADQLFKMLGKKHQAIVLIDGLQSYVVENQKVLNATNLFEYATHLLVESENRECVKFGLSLLELFKTDNDKLLKERVRTIGLSDEFALFAIFVMLHWEDGNNEVWQLAKKLHGWGRIHAIERIAPETEEIRRWLLLEGVHNDVMPAYSALTCWDKSNAEDVLTGGPSREEFAGIRDIIEGLLDEGPVPGISELLDGDDIIATFLDAAEKMELSLDDYKVIYRILACYRERYSDSCPIALVCKKLLHTYHSWCLILDAVKQGDCLDLAIGVGIDVKPYAFELINASFEDHYYLCRYLMHDPEYRGKTIELYRSRLPLEEMKTMPTRTHGLGKEYWKQSALEYVLQELGDHPCEGEDFVEVGLQSAPVRTRNGALNVLESWVSAEQKPLSELLPDMWKLISKLRDIEPDDKVKNRMDKLVAGATAFSRFEINVDQ